VAHPTKTKFRAIRSVRRSRRFADLQARGRGFRDTGQGVPVAKPPGIFREIVTGLYKTAKGEATFPLPGVGGVGAGRALQLRAIGRQQLARVPLPAKIIGGAVGITALTEATTGMSPIPLARQLAMRAGQAIGSQFSGDPGPVRAPQRRKPVPRGGLSVGQELPPSHVVVRTWQTFPGGPVFARLADGHIAVQKKDGTIKHFRPYRPVVIPRKWNARSMSRVATALKRQRKVATKILQITGGVPKRTARVGRAGHAMVGRDV